MSGIVLCIENLASLVAELVKNPSAMQETWVQSLGGEDPLKKGKATHSSILARRTPWSIPLGCRVAHDWQTFTFFTTSATWEALTSYYCCVTSVVSNCV